MTVPGGRQRNVPAQIIGDPVSRRGFLTGSGLVIGAGSAAFISACGSGDGGAVSDQDTDLALLGHALALELTAVEAYWRATKPLDGGDLATFRTFLTQEQEHADALARAIKLRGGNAGARSLPLDYPRMKSPREALAFAADLENVLIAAYVEAIPRLSRSDLRATAAEIAADEAEHLAVLAGELGRPQAPDAFVAGDPGALSQAGLRAGTTASALRP